MMRRKKGRLGLLNKDGIRKYLRKRGEEIQSNNICHNCREEGMEKKKVEKRLCCSKEYE